MLAVSANTFGRESLDVSARFAGVRISPCWSVFVWVVSWAVQIFACISLLYFAEVKVTCVVTFFGESTETTVYRRLTLQIVDTLSSGTCLTVFFAYPHRYVARSRQHFWTLCFVCASFVGSWTALMFMMATCGYGRFHDIQFVTMAFSNLVSMVILLWLCLLKVRSVAAAAPCMVRVCEISAIVIAIAGTLCAIVLIMKLTDGRLVVLFGCASLLLILGFGTFFFAVVYVLSRAGRAALSEALQTDVDEKSSCQIRIAAKWTIITAITSAAAGASSIIYFVTHLFTYIRKSPDAQIILGDVRCVDAIMNRAAALFLSGLLDRFGDVKRTSIHLQQVRATLHSQRRRDIEERLLNEAGASTGSALTIIALMDGVDPNIVLQEAVSRFRCVSWDTLATRPDIIVGGGPLDVLGPGGNDLHSLSQPCELGACDVFLSHSWHDDPLAKWAALESWCDDFIRTEGRCPLLWLDKVCLDQANITQDLRNLPIFLAGCNRLLVAHGSTFTTRLWCSMELLVYRAMFVNDETRRPPELLSLGNSQQRESNLLAWSNYNVDNCECFNKEDKRRFLDVVAHYPGGAEGFNQYMREIVKDFHCFPDMYDFVEFC